MQQDFMFFLVFSLFQSHCVDFQGAGRVSKLMQNHTHHKTTPNTVSERSSDWPVSWLLRMPGLSKLGGGLRKFPSTDVTLLHRVPRGILRRVLLLRGVLFRGILLLLLSWVRLKRDYCNVLSDSLYTRGMTQTPTIHIDSQHANHTWERTWTMIF